MCGIAGFLDLSHSKSSSELRPIIQKMSNTLKHRGPDDSGVWVDSAAGIALGHRRLSIIDLTPAGHQPMFSSSGRYVTVFNGEIYNYNEIREELERKGVLQWRGHSDTEVVLAAIEVWGVEETLRRSVGMFALALWDRRERILHLARDRMGEKPLYYGRMANYFLFGSELKALLIHPAFTGRVDRQALALFLHYNYVPSPFSIYKGILKLPPGTILTIDPSSRTPVLTPRPYWTLKGAVERGLADPFTGTAGEATALVEELLINAVKVQKVADVPVGAFLSGGVDSSTVVAFMQLLHHQPIKTFTIGFHEQSYNEASDAKEIAQYLGTEHSELYVSANQALDVIPNLSDLYDEPFAAPSSIPMFLVSKLAREKVTVCLSGDGGDELFAGYNRYLIGQNLWRRLSGLPPWMKNKTAMLMKSLSPQYWDSLFFKIWKVLPKKLRYQSPGDKLYKLADVLCAESEEDFYRRLVSQWNDTASVIIGAHYPEGSIVTDKEQRIKGADLTLQSMYFDALSYLPDEVLVKVDRASMGVSLETRMPMLDHRVVEFAWRIPLSMKIRDRQGKWLLRQVLYKYVPERLFERPKKGFTVPLDSWLRGPLREWAESLLNPARLKKEGFFRPESIQGKWKAHVSGKANWQYHLWNVLMFQAWLERNRAIL